MHICFICNEYPPDTHGGVGTFTQTMARAMVAAGQRVTVVGIYPSATHETVSDDAGVRVLRLPHSSKRFTGFLVGGARIRRALTRVSERDPIDVVEGPENSLAVVPPSFSAACVIRMHGGHAFFATTLGRQTAVWRSWQERRSFRRATHFCAVSRYVAEATRQLLHLRDRPIEILPNPVNTEFFRPMPDMAEKSGLILFAGTLTEKKGIRQLLEAMPAIVQAAPGASLIAAGRDSSDPVSGQSFTARLRELVSADLSPRINFAGEVDRDRLRELMASAAVCVFPSHMEAMPIAWLEAMAMGKAVVASQTGPGPEVVSDGVSGLLCNPRDPASIAAKVIAALRDSSLRVRLGAAARDRAKRDFSLQAMTRRNLDFYHACSYERQTARH